MYVLIQKHVFHCHHSSHPSSYCTKAPKYKLKRRRDQDINAGDVGEPFGLQPGVPTSTGAMSGLLEARLAGAEGVCAVGDAVGLVAVPALGPVAPAVIHLGVCTERQSESE